MQHVRIALTVLFFMSTALCSAERPKTPEVTVTPHDASVSSAFDELRRKGGPRVAVLGTAPQPWAFPRWTVRIPTEYRFKPVSGYELIEAVAAAALVCQRPVTVEATLQNIWGTKVVNLESEYRGHTPAEHGYGALTSTRLDEATEQFEEAVMAILRVAPMDLKLRALAEDMRKTSRRVNALEQRLLPQLNAQVRYIENALDQREREDIFRLKRLKRKKSGPY